MEYLEPYPTADRILSLFTPEVPAGLTHSDILRRLEIKHGTTEAGFV